MPTLNAWLTRNGAGASGKVRVDEIPVNQTPVDQPTLDQPPLDQPPAKPVAFRSALRIAAVAVPNPVLLAPMSGITDVPFRRQVAALGAGMVVSEMTASADLAQGRPLARLRSEAIGQGAHVVQLAGCEPRWMAEGARMAEAAGADIIDINMGCPARNVTGSQSGSALMRDPDHALRLIEATRAAVKVPVTVKMRLGWDRGTLNAPTIARRAQESGVAMITVHGRTRCQFYAGAADWRAVRAVRDVVTVPLVVNGDIVSEETAEAALAQSGADAVMIGRGAVGKPWLLGQIGRRLAGGAAEAVPPLTMQLAWVRDLYTETLAHYGTAIGLRHARKHLSASLDAAATQTRAPLATLKAWRSRILTGTQPADVLRDLADAFDDFAWRAAA